ncbi:putative endoplasmic reticulum membrane protein [Yarrowia sp. B02]|nr:putative endoplasmic reticulum membrane protein [Yarrowia sp. B02]
MSTKPAKVGAYDLKNQLAFYRAYHSNPVNVVIHVICVPIILLTSYVLLTNLSIVPLLSKIGVPLPSNPWVLSQLNWGMITAIHMNYVYIRLDPPFGLLAASILLPACAYFPRLTWGPESGSVNMLAGILFVISWIAQFYGHGAHEKRAPALLDNLRQALVLAPFFVLFEIASFFGFRQDVLRDVDAIIANRKDELLKGQ